jgi:hypothetical protein
MISQGIYTLANDLVYDQLVALLNSIEKNVSADIPICVISFDDKLERIKTEIDRRSNVTLFNNQESIERWESFVKKVWNVYPKYKRKWQLSAPWGTGHHRKFVAFDGIFDRFVYYDADSLAMKPLADIFEKLNSYDFVFDDWEHSKPIGSTALDIPLIVKGGIYREEEIRPQLHCSSFFGSKKGILNFQELADLEDKLTNEGEIAWVARWWDDAFLFNYLTLRCNRPLYNFTTSPKGQDRTGNCADSDPFVNIDNVLYNEEGLKPIHRIHYMNYSSADFARLCQGEDANIRYKDVFLYYRFLQEPEKRPKQLKPPSILSKAGRKLQKLVAKIQRTISSQYRTKSLKSR